LPFFAVFAEIPGFLNRSWNVSQLSCVGWGAKFAGWVNASLTNWVNLFLRRRTGGTSGASKSSSSSFSVPEETQGASRSQQTIQSGAVQDVSALIALQSVDDALHGKKRKAVRKGNKMLDLLEEIRMGILCGSLSISVLRQLERLSAETEASGDERIDTLLEEISLRAQVEVAKLEALHKN
jgi:hypothetical protein